MKEKFRKITRVFFIIWMMIGAGLLLFSLASAPLQDWKYALLGFGELAIKIAAAMFCVWGFRKIYQAVKSARQNHILSIAFILMLCGCAFDTFDKELPKFKGKHIHSVADYFGAPDSVKTFANKKYYVWESEIQTSTLGVQTTRTTGNVGGKYYSGNSQTLVREPVTYSCKLTFITDQKDIIERIGYEGNQGGCEYYADKIAPHTEVEQ